MIFRLTGLVVAAALSGCSTVSMTQLVGNLNPLARLYMVPYGEPSVSGSRLRVVTDSVVLLILDRVIESDPFAFNPFAFTEHILNLAMYKNIYQALY